MSQLTDQNYLLSSQYKDSTNLNARMLLHQRFSANPYGLMRWAFDQYNLPPDARVLEVGCGTGLLWQDNLSRIPEGWRITLTDLSPGMVEQARKNLANGPQQFEFREADAQSLPFGDGEFDAVIANYMLYHVPDRPKAYKEIRRALKPRGYFYATTLGNTHLLELSQLVTRFHPQAWEGQSPFGGFQGATNQPFNLENGGDELAQYFSDVILRRYEDSLLVTEAEPLVSYVMSTGSRSFFEEGDRLGEFRAFVERELAENGAIRISKDSGMFVARR